MGSGFTRYSAREAAARMKAAGFTPGTIINVGVGSCPEAAVWEAEFPGVPCIGIDPRRNRWITKLRGWTYVWAAAGDGSVDRLPFCKNCGSIICNAPEHIKRTTVRAVTLDEVTRGVPGPYFVWMDIEGSELEALRGAAKTLADTEWINIEMREFLWVSNHVSSLEAFLKDAGFALAFRRKGLIDRLYKKERIQ